MTAVTASLNQGYKPQPDDPVYAASDSLTKWLLGQALRGESVGEVVQGLCEQIRSQGIGLLRGHVGLRTLHPQYHAFTHTWYRGSNVVTRGYMHGQNETDPVWLQSPFFYMMDQDIPLLRQRFATPEDVSRFPIFAELKDKGVTDYLGFMVAFSDERDDKSGVDGILGSWTTDNPDGFSPSDLWLLQSLHAPLAVAVRVHMQMEISANIASAYLGRRTGQRVLDGTIQRGAGDDIEGVIWFCDLRSSTALSESMARADYLNLLNDFLEEMTEAVHAHGGEVLRFIGDAALAIFPVDAPECSGFTNCVDVTRACDHALHAANDAIDRVDRLNAANAEQGRPQIRFGIGLHYGEFTYGNIGSPDRVEFTVIGAAPNEAARIQGMCKTMDRKVITSDTFAKAYDGDLLSLGSHVLRGFRDVHELYTLPDH